MRQSFKDFKTKYIIISIILYLLTYNNLSAKTKLVSDIQVFSNGDEFAEYQVKALVYPASIVLSRFLLNDNSNTRTIIQINEKIKEPEFSIEKDKHQLLIVTNTSGLHENFLQQLINNIIALEYGCSPDSLKGGALSEGCYSYVRRALNADKQKRQELIMTSYLASLPIKLQSEAITKFNDSNADGLIKYLFRELSELFITSVLSLSNGKILLQNYALGEKIDSEEIDKIMNNKLRLFGMPPTEQINNEIAIKNYLKEVEAEKIPVSRRYSYYFFIIEENPPLLNIIWPELGKYLDKEYPMKYYAE
ncbi:MAG TPA: hypothetical protein DD381_03785 [Lentisphaeria bacterium]|nr:MAG: hypothetical protein A2X47_06845 [Lentisphaerae bacterium GWF2_38_69]HBM15453.1 hypothetical protein [Lentisphaeria bacterium]